ncbi:MAG TPA: hypothetical protein DCE56_02400 [Cyanobacteria bacterium UBA8553]|nr:hypothetical protein [Cyanobacteria bacterium UBA8553]HAJ63931.1 hypothetical protein [Cyanobacteria bacterium UBA8543]
MSRSRQQSAIATCNWQEFLGIYSSTPEVYQWLAQDKNLTSDQQKWVEYWVNRFIEFKQNKSKS